MLPPPLSEGVLCEFNKVLFILFSEYFTCWFARKLILRCMCKAFFIMEVFKHIPILVE